MIQGMARFRSPKDSLGDLDAETAARVVAAASDVAMVIDGAGVVRDVAVSEGELAAADLAQLVDRRWIDTVTSESRPKIEDLLREALENGDVRWREVNHQTPKGTIPIRYIAFNSGNDGKVIAIGRDLRRVAELQQRLLQAQQAMERDYVRLRQAESRYRLLFQLATEAVLIVEPQARRIVEANPAAQALAGSATDALAGQGFLRLFHTESRDAAAVLLKEAAGPARAEPVLVRLADGRGDYAMSASLFRQDSAALVLVRLWSTKTETASAREQRPTLLRVLNRIPDAFVVADEDLAIVETNMAFLELSQIPSAEVARGQSLRSFIGRPGIDLTVLLATLREHGWVRNFATVFNSAFGAQEEVELSAVTVREGLETYHGFTIRTARRRAAAPAESLAELPRSPEQLKELVGRVSLREIVRETTDVIERMCIEAALNLTGNNRASAAEMLGLSRQSLYSKLNRYGLGSADIEGDARN